jgi:hypothetical protein
MARTKAATLALAGIGLGALALGNLYVTEARAAANDLTVIKLTQTGCQFVESENGKDHGYSPKTADDCKTINGKSGDKRLAEAKPITLKAGKYRFRVTNKNVPYSLGFWIRSEGYDWKNPLHKLSKVSVSGGGLTTGKTRDYEVELKPGEYVYSCPLNPTPNYRLVVTQ